MLILGIKFKNSKKFLELRKIDQTEINFRISEDKKFVYVGKVITDSKPINLSTLIKKQNMEHVVYDLKVKLKKHFNITSPNVFLYLI